MLEVLRPACGIVGGEGMPPAAAVQVRVVPALVCGAGAPHAGAHGIALPSVVSSASCFPPTAAAGPLGAQAQAMLAKFSE